MFATFASTLVCPSDYRGCSFLSIAFFEETYGFGPGVGGLVYLGLGIGFVAATLFGAKVADPVYKRVRVPCIV